MLSASDALILSQLGPREQVLWRGRAGHGLDIRWFDYLGLFMAFLGGLFWGFWLVLAIGRGSLVLTLVFLSLLVVWVIGGAGHPVRRARARRRLIYAVTTQRALIVQSGRRGEVRAVSLRACPSTSLRGHRNRTGTILFGPPVSSIDARFSPPIAFERIAHPGQVLALIRHIQSSLVTPGERS